MQVQRTLKRREGVWGIVKGDKGEIIIIRKHCVLAMASSPPVPLDEKSKVENRKKIRKQAESKNIESKRCFASLNMTMDIFACAILCHCEA